MAKSKKKDYKEIVKHIAELSMLKLSKQEIETFAPQLKDILNYVSKLENVDTEDTPETHQVTGLENVLREDKVGKMLTQKQALSNAPDSQDGYFKVPGKLSNVTA